MNSKILRARVSHERLQPRAHAFFYRFPLYLVDLDEIRELDRRNVLFGYNRLRPVSLFDRDYLREGKGSIREKLFSLLDEQGVDTSQIRQVLLLTAARFFHYVFNPVSVYFVLGDTGLVCLVAEVNNTFGEKHAYVLRHDRPTIFPARFTVPKVFHVSPFFDRQGEYHFEINDIRTHSLGIIIRLYREGQQVFSATLENEGLLRDITDRRILAENLRFPGAAHLTWPRILWEAGRLWTGRKAAFHSKPRPMSDMTIRTGQRRWEKCINTLARKAVFSCLHKAGKGCLRIGFPGGSELISGQEKGVDAVMQVREMGVFTRLALQGDIGLGETWTDGRWDADDLNRVLRFMLENRRVVSPVSTRGIRHLLQCGLLDLVRPLRGPLRRNSQGGSRDNIRAHYDLSNAFFQTFLDESMAYSCAVYRHTYASESLEEAQRRKYAMIAEKAGIRPGDHVLEIGCGWGGFALETARNLDCRITGLTLSREQYDLARERVAEAGLEDRIQILFEDYRNIRGMFDAVVSIEMVEAVGHGFHPQFFKAVDALLRPGGKAVIQCITIQDGQYAIYRRGMCWIRKHIFPGGTLLSLTRIAGVLTRHTELNIMHAETFGLDYARTLAEWRARFMACLDQVRALGFDEPFIRTWLFYFAICEEAFRCGHINDYQIVMARPEEKCMADHFISKPDLL